jgi:hypothetical protein
MVDLQTELIRFTQADALNDPCDSIRCMTDYIQDSIEYVKEKLGTLSADLLERTGRERARYTIMAMHFDFLTFSRLPQ